jgi:hypothetical protein
VNEYEENSEIIKRLLRKKEVKNLERFKNLSDEKIIAVLDFLVELAKLEIKIQEKNLI